MHCTTPPNFNKPLPSSCETLHIHIVDIYIYIWKKNCGLITSLWGITVCWLKFTMSESVLKLSTNPSTNRRFFLFFSFYCSAEYQHSSMWWIILSFWVQWIAELEGALAGLFHSFFFFFLKVSKLFYLSTEHLPNKNTIWALEVNWFKAVLNY